MMMFTFIKNLFAKPVVQAEVIVEPVTSVEPIVKLDFPVEKAKPAAKKPAVKAKTTRLKKTKK